MRLHWLVFLACLHVASGCARTITIGKDPEPAQAAEKPAEPKRYRVSLPKDHTVYTPMFLDMLKALDEGVGYEMLILPAPLFEATTEFRWMKAEDKTKVDELCVASPSETDDPAWGAFKIELSIEYAKTFWNSKSPIKDTMLYKVFLHCVGHALGFEHVTTNPADVMAPEPSETADLAAFHARVRALNHPNP